MQVLVLILKAQVNLGQELLEPIHKVWALSFAVFLFCCIVTILKGTVRRYCLLREAMQYRIMSLLSMRAFTRFYAFVITNDVTMAGDNSTLSRLL